MPHSPGNRERCAVGEIQRADQRPIVSIEGMNESVVHVADQELATERAEA